MDELVHFRELPAAVSAAVGPARFETPADGPVAGAGHPAQWGVSWISQHDEEIQP